MEQPHNGLAGFKDDEYEPSICESNVRSVVSHASQDTLLKQFRDYEPHSSMVDVETLRASEHLKVKRFKESAYYGEIQSSKRHGQGIMVYHNDRVYEGNWENDYKNGKGYEMFPNGSVYQGEYATGKPEGLGKYSWPNGEFYEGEWLNGLKHGSGMWQGAKNDSYVGEWSMGKAEGYGVHVWINGDRYQGEFKNCLKQGQGTEKFANGDLYKGEYQKGKPNGYGEYYWSNTSYFKGTFKQGLRDGHGMWKKGLGVSDKYEGQYHADKKHGYGIFSWASGNVYKGYYEQDLRNGYGQMYWGDGSYYKGEWRKSIQHGEGVLFIPEQGTKKGIFKDNVLVEIIEEELPVAPVVHQSRPNHSRPYIPRPGSIQKNSNSNNSNNPLQQQQGIPINYRNIENKRKVLSVYDHPHQPSKESIKLSRNLHPLTRKGDKRVNKTTNVVEIQKCSSHTANARSRERIPHSAFYMHKLHKRVSTASNEEKTTPYLRNRTKGEITDELRSFTKKMVGRRPL